MALLTHGHDCLNAVEAALKYMRRSCRQETSLSLSQCWLGSMSPSLGHIELFFNIECTVYMLYFLCHSPLTGVDVNHREIHWLSLRAPIDSILGAPEYTIWLSDLEKRFWLSKILLDSLNNHMLYCANEELLITGILQYPVNANTVVVWYWSVLSLISRLLSESY